MKIVYKLLNILFLTVPFFFISGTPLKAYTNYFTLFCIFLCLFFVSKKFFLNKNFYYSFLRKIQLLFLLLLLLGIIAAQLNIGKSIVNSIKANFDFFALLVLIFYAFVFYKQKIDISEFKKIITVYIIVELILLVVFKDSTKDLVRAGEGIVNRDRLPKNFIRFGVIYFFSVFLKKGKATDGIIALFLLLFPNIISDFQRAYFAIAVFVVSLSFFLTKKNRKSVNLFLVGSFICALLPLLILTFNLSSNIWAKAEQKYSAVIAQIGGNKDESDVSVKYRIIEAKLAIQQFIKNPVIGGGRVGSEGVGIDRAYYPSDVGIIGILGTYGIVGLIIYLYLFILALKLFLKTVFTTKPYSAFTLATSIYAFNLALESFVTADIVLRPVFFVFMYLLANYSKQTDETNWLEELDQETSDLDEAKLEYV